MSRPTIEAVRAAVTKDSDDRLRAELHAHDPVSYTSDTVAGYSRQELLDIVKMSSFYVSGACVLDDVTESSPPLIYLEIEGIKRSFIHDSGTEVSVLPPSYVPSLQSHSIVRNVNLRSAFGEKVRADLVVIQCRLIDDVGMTSS